VTALGVIGEEREVRLGPDVIRYREVGSGPTLVFVHGILASGVLWRDVVAASPGGSGALFRILRSAGTPCR
jgi:pimeloyl-ACP methyl ester carboxylesterase